MELIERIDPPVDIDDAAEVSSQAIDARQERAWCTALRARLKGKIGALVCINAFVYVVYRVCAVATGHGSSPAVATRVLTALCSVPLTTSLWINAKPHVLRMLVIRPRYAPPDASRCDTLVVIQGELFHSFCAS